MTLTRYSNSSNGAEYELTSKEANVGIIKLAYEYGRGEGGEVIQLHDDDGELIAEARWTPEPSHDIGEDGAHYYECEV